jgi:beta-mannosidase
MYVNSSRTAIQAGIAPRIPLEWLLLCQRSPYSPPPREAYTDLCRCIYSSLDEVVRKVNVKLISIETGKTVCENDIPDIKIAANGTKEPDLDSNGTGWVCVTYEIPKPPEFYEMFHAGKQDPLVYHASLRVGHDIVSEDVPWPNPIKYLNFKERDVVVRYLYWTPGKVYISAIKPVNGFVFDEWKGLRLSDNGFDIMPGSTKTVSFEGCESSELTWRESGARLRNSGKY